MEVKKEIDEYLSFHSEDQDITGRMALLPLILASTKEKWHQAFLAFRDKFCDSEQILRCFLFNKIDELLAPLRLTEDGILSLNIHSTRDPCRYCTNALFLESFLLGPKGFRIGKKDNQYVGFLHKFFDSSRVGSLGIHKPQVFIFVSSQTLETEGGVARRLTSGRFFEGDETIESPIDVENPVRFYFRYNGP